MKPITITIRGSQQKDHAKEVIDDLEEDGSMEVEVRERKRDLSAQQRGLYFMWLGIMAGETGNDKDSLHHEMKRKHLTKIYMRDDEEYRQAAHALKSLKGTKEHGPIARQIVDLTSIMDASVEQMTELINAVEHEAINLGITLPYPQDLYEAMGCNGGNV